MHDEYLKPIIPSKFNVGFKVTNCDLPTLHQLEPWCDKIYLDSDTNVIEEYISKEQVNTQYNLKDRIFNLNSEIDTDVIVEMDAKNINYNHIQQLSMIIDNTDEVGEFELDGLNIKINKINRLEKDLIIRK